MEHLRRSIEASLASGNAYAALALTLALPDICGWLLSPRTNSKARYVEWFERYVGPHYVHFTGANHERTVFLSGADCYALRCAFLHEGREDISEQRAKQLLDSFQITVAPSGWLVHCNLYNTRLQLQLDIFCLQFVAGVAQFEQDIANNVEVGARMAAMLRIRDVNGSVVP